jgi:hypothetical protein
MFLSRLLTSVGFISLGMLLLSAAIFRAATCLRRNPAFGEITGETASETTDEITAASLNA